MQTHSRGASAMVRHSSLLTILLATVAALSGCRPQQPGYLFNDGDLSHYVGVATQIEYPDVEQCSLDDARGDMPPLTLENAKPKEIWDLRLEEAMQITLRNSNVLRNLGGVVFGGGGTQGEPSSLLSRGNSGVGVGVATTWDPALAESDPRFGVEAALAAFDTQLAASSVWTHGLTPQNSTLAFRPDPLIQDTATFQAQLQKQNVTGGTVSLRHDLSYQLDNTSPALKKWPSAYTAGLQAEIRQPVLQGYGVLFNRIAGAGAVPGFNNGVMIARLRTDDSLANFEGAVRQLVSDVEKAYWETYYAYRRLDSVIAGRDSALQTWRQVRAKYELGGRGGGAQEEAQARQQYFTFRGAVEEALSNLYSTENHLRYMLGLASTDGRLIRPADEPTTAKVSFDWYESHAESMVRSVELRQKKYQIKQRELELLAAKNWLLPRLDGVARYRWNGQGHVLLDSDNAEENAYGSLASGQFPEWQLGFEFRLPLGFRREMAGVRNAQLALARERTILQEQELELSHQLAMAFRELTDNLVISQTHFNRRIAAQREVDAVAAAYANGTATLDLLLSAQQRKAEAEVQYYRTLVDYNLAISNVHFRKGSLLEYNGVCLAEGPWPAKAYFDARRRARARDSGIYLDYGFTQPRVISRGAVIQNAGTANAPATPGIDSAVPAEAIPTPAPEQTTPPAAPAVPQPAPETPKLDLLPAKPQVGPLGKAGARPAQASTARRFDLGAKNLAALAEPTLAPADGGALPAPAQISPMVKVAAQPTLTIRSTVEKASHQEPVNKTTDSRPASGWRNPKQPESKPASPMPAPAPASGWKAAR